jgi:hypothetical protein
MSLRFIVLSRQVAAKAARAERKKVAGRAM